MKTRSHTNTNTDHRTTLPPQEGTIPHTHNVVALYVEVQHSADFARLRSRSRRYLAAMTLLFLGAFLTTVIIAGWAPGAFARPVLGQVNLGMLFAVGLILLPVLVSAVHLRYAGRRLDPLAERIREDFERSRQ